MFKRNVFSTLFMHATERKHSHKPFISGPAAYCHSAVQDSSCFAGRVKACCPLQVFWSPILGSNINSRSSAGASMCNKKERDLSRSCDYCLTAVHM